MTLLRPPVPERRPGRPAVARAEINEDLMLVLETLIAAVKRRTLYQYSELAVIIRDAEAVIKRAHWERAI